MKAKHRALKAFASSTRLIAAGGLAGVVANWIVRDTTNLKLFFIMGVAIGIGSIIEYWYLSFEEAYEEEIGDN